MKAWREAASLILAGRHGPKYIGTLSPTNFQYNYNLLCLRRHQNSKFMPSTYVFPGGVVHPSDADLKWQSLFNTFGFDSSSFASLSPKTTSRPNIFKTGPNELPKEISLRITAIRETFEECGVLICKKSRDENVRPNWADHTEVLGNELHTWQTKVHNDATEFYTLCQKLECYPDLWSLHEWSNWLTPTHFSGRRYDTVFYLTCMPFMPRANYDPIEMEELKWDVPGNFLLSSMNVLLPPPQQYEIARIAKFENIDNLLDFAVDRSKMGIQVNLPVKVELRDGKVHVLPGDSMYPKQVNYLENQVIDRTDITISEFRDISPVKNRMEFSSLEVKELCVQNFNSVDGHLPPMQLRNIRVCSNKL